MRSVTDPSVETIVLALASQLGKALDPTTPIPTPDGWRTIGDLTIGDQVFDQNGDPTIVRATAEWHDRPTFRITFSDGSSIVADEQHEWIVRVERTRPPQSKTYQSKRRPELIGEVRQFDIVRMTTDQLARSKWKIGQRRFSIRCNVTVEQLGLRTLHPIDPADRSRVSRYRQRAVKLNRLIDPVVQPCRTVEIVSVDRVPDRTTVCIEVSSPSHLFLAGPTAIPTHNSEILNNILAYHAHFDPGPSMVVQPTIEMSEAFSKDRVQPMFRDSPELAKLFDWKSRDASQTIRHLKFAGGSITFSGANSAASLASRPIRIALMDEIDRYPLSVGEEGSPISLVRTRTRNFWNRKIVMVSTPTVEGTSLIWSELQRSDWRVYDVPCTHCGAFQNMTWEHVTWTAGQPASAEYVCEHCDQPWSESQRRDGVHHGCWRATKQSATRGYHLNALVSLFNPLSYLAKEFEQVGNDRLRMIGFQNTALALPVRDEQVELSDPLRLRERAENFSLKQIPDDVVLITAGLDVQPDRIEITHLGWGVDDEVWVLDHSVMTGDPTKSAVWDEVQQVLQQKHQHPCGQLLTVESASIDSGFATQSIYDFAAAAQQRGKRWYAIKGRQGELPIWRRGSKRLSHGSPVPFFIVGTDTSKVKLARMLATAEPGPSFVHFSSSLTPEWFEQLTSERLVTRFVKNQVKRVWERQPGLDAEALDCFIYSMAARYSLTIDLKDRARRFAEQKTGSQQKKTVRSAADIAKMFR